MSKKRTTLVLDEKNVEKMKNHGINISEFCNNCIAEFLRQSKNNKSNELANMENELLKIQMKISMFHKQQSDEYKYLLMSEEEKIQSYWSELLDNCEDYYYSQVNPNDIEVIRNLSSLVNVSRKTLLEIALNTYQHTEFNSLSKDIELAIQRYEYDNNTSVDRFEKMAYMRL